MSHLHIIFKLDLDARGGLNAVVHVMIRRHWRGRNRIGHRANDDRPVDIAVDKRQQDFYART